jgi:hypothetical protein
VKKVATKLETKVGRDALGEARAFRLRSVLLAAIRERPHTTQQLRALTAVETGEHRSRNRTTATLRALKRERVVYSDGEQWRPRDV